MSDYYSSRGDANAKELVAARLWGPRRASDAYSHMSTDALYHETLGKLDLRYGTGNTYLIPNEPSRNDAERGVRNQRAEHPPTPELPPTPPMPPTPDFFREVIPPPCPTPPLATTRPEKPFLSWAEFHPFPITLRNHTIQSPREELIHALDHIESAKVKGVGRLARPLINRLHTAQQLSDFLAHAERSILRPFPAAALYPNPTARELDRLESELFDTAKFTGSGDNHVTVLTWSADSPRGTITLFEADLFRNPDMALPLSSNRRTPRRVGCAMSLRPVAAMEDVPRQVLVNMRTDQGVRKLVLKHDMAENRFRWGARYGSEPRYARLLDDLDGYDDEDDSTTARSTGHARRARERSSLRGGRDHRGEADCDGVVATIPQFLALLHASRSIVEVASAGAISDDKVETEDCERFRAVVLRDWPEGKRHTGREVHVVVLVPAAAKWADEPIFWTDEASSLRELRQKKYRDVIEGAVRRPRTSRTPRTPRSGYGRDRDRRSISPTLPSPARSAAW
ncbi:hypothetical protein N656DRAFT_752871 [Canariomyces notabilis]|uniref:Uncharacterized protein n=1 Tax=Canariomyces notabilis TaxID=2074819 RepID=A0AAN6YT39_9PEZI|nr:hypothetical protein N656DRAFT_752871 [Canariomyces arenarius]